MFKVGIIEDSRTIRSLFAKFLKGMDLSLNFFASRQEDLDGLDDFKPDLIICSGTLEYQSIHHVQEFITQSSNLTHASLVITTSMNVSTTKDACQLFPISGVLHKPFTKERLQSLIQKTMREHHRRGRTQPLIVIVDDSITARKIVRSHLEPFNVEVVEAQDGEEGYRVILEMDPDLAILDIEMPKMNGFELSQKLAHNPLTASIPILVVSSVVNAEMVFGGFPSGVIDFIQKPVDALQLKRAISSTLKKHMVEGKTALILEDSPVISSIISRQLKQMGFTTFVCPTIDEFVSYLSLTIPDLITLDLNLPDGNGHDCVVDIRSQPVFDMTPIVIISDQRDKSVFLDCLRDGADDYLQKPFASEEFEVRINSLLRMRSLQIELQQKARILEKLAYSDGLTGLLNRRFFDEELQREIQHANESGQPFSFVMIDLDHFKKVNDTYGHEAGDQILRDISYVIKTTVRVQDTVCRYGGEEMCILFPETPLSKAKVVAEKVRFRCQHLLFTNCHIRQTVSIGVSCYPETSSSERVIEDADTCLYEAKEKGRNQVIAAPLIQK